MTNVPSGAFCSAASNSLNTNKDLEAIKTDNEMIQKKANELLAYDQNLQSKKEWVFTLLISKIPIVNVIMLTVWAFLLTDNENRANWARVELVYAIVGVVSLALAIAYLWLTTPIYY